MSFEKKTEQTSTDFFLSLMKQLKVVNGLTNNATNFVEIVAEEVRNVEALMLRENNEAAQRSIAEFDRLLKLKEMWLERIASVEVEIEEMLREFEKQKNCFDLSMAQVEKTADEMAKNNMRNVDSLQDLIRTQLS